MYFTFIHLGSSQKKKKKKKRIRDIWSGYFYNKRMTEIHHASHQKRSRNILQILYVFADEKFSPIFHHLHIYSLEVFYVTAANHLFCVNIFIILLLFSLFYWCQWCKTFFLCECFSYYFIIVFVILLMSMVQNIFLREHFHCFRYFIDTVVVIVIIYYCCSSVMYVYLLTNVCLHASIIFQCLSFCWLLS